VRSSVCRTVQYSYSYSPSNVIWLVFVCPEDWSHVMGVGSSLECDLLVTHTLSVT
jgi:hypothetical protein